VPLTRHLSLRLTSEGHRRLSALAEARGVNLGRCVRQLIDEADVDAPAKPRRELSEADLIDLLRERAADGNVSAITRLLDLERQRDPRADALAALEAIAQERQS
jgi:predicted DNA-binding ribbon-helix-helix protein